MRITREKDLKKQTHALNCLINRSLIKIRVLREIYTYMQQDKNKYKQIF